MEKIILSSLSIIGVTVISLYIWRSRRKEQNEIHQIQIKIHNAEVGHLIGKSGGKIKDIIIKSGAKIRFFLQDVSHDYCLCTIEGNKTGVEKARRIISQILEQYTNINSCFSSKDVNNGSFSLLSNKFDESSNNEDKENQIDILQHSLVTDYVTGHTQKLDSSNNDGLIPIYVSAVATPDSFWVQSIKTKEHIELDRLTEELCEYYKTHLELNDPPHYSEVKFGYICATCSVDDNRWYRAEVSDVSPLNESNNNETILDLYFLDYGVSCYQKLKNIRKIPQKFLELKFQAIECGLSHIKPEGNTWSEESLSFFEDITHVGQWHTLMARIDKENENGHPQLTLINTNSGEDINLADEMVNKGFARYSIN